MKQTILFALFLVGGFMGFAQNPLVKQWDKRFGGVLDDYLQSLQQTADNGYILGGQSNSYISGDVTQPSKGMYDYWIVKTDSMGNKQWDKKFGGNTYDFFFCLEETNDAGYILGGETDSDSSGDITQQRKGNTDFWVVKTDSLGSKQWDRRFGGDDVNRMRSVKQTKDGGYILGGWTTSDSSGDISQSTRGGLDFWILKIDALGNKQWDKRFGGSGDDYLSSLIQSSDEGYLISGYILSDSSGDITQERRDTSTLITLLKGDYWVIKLDSSGNKQWDKRFGGNKNDYLSSTIETYDKGYFLWGMTYSDSSGDVSENSKGGYDYWLVKIDSVGSKQWDKRIGGHDNDEDFGYIRQTIDGGYILSGTSYSNIGGDKTENNLGLEQIWIIKIDQSGNIAWDKTIFTAGHEELGIAIQSNDGCYVAATYTSTNIGGYKTQMSRGGADFWFAKFCDTSNVTNVSPLSLQEEPQVRIFPNPATDQLFIETNGEEIKQVNIYNTMGEVVMAVQQIINHQLSIINLPTGVYIAEVKTKDASVKKRWVKE